jgi:hypothetical protein
MMDVRARGKILGELLAQEAIFSDDPGIGYTYRASRYTHQASRYTQRQPQIAQKPQKPQMNGTPTGLEARGGIPY